MTRHSRLDTVRTPTGATRRGSARLVLAAVLLCGAPARGAEFDGPGSTMEITIGGLPRIATTGVDTGTLFLRNGSGGHSISIYASTYVWRVPGFEMGTQAFAGIPQISNAVVYAGVTIGFVADGYQMVNRLGGNAPIGPGMGGYMIIWGSMVLEAMSGSVQKPIHLTMGRPAGYVSSTPLPVWYASTTTFQGLPITRTTGPAFTAPLAITGITTNLITIPARSGVQGVAFTLQPAPSESVRTPSTNGGFVSISGGAPIEQHTVTISGSQDLLSAEGGGTVTLVTPMRIRTGEIAGNLPGAGRFHFHFVPEPDRLLLLLVGLPGLFLLARLRSRS